MEKYLITVLLFWFYLVAAAQDANTMQQTMGTPMSRNNTWLYETNNNFATEGTPLWNTSWKEGWLTDNKGKKYDKILLKYNILQGEVMFKTSKGDSLLAYSALTSGFGFYGTILVSFQKIAENPKQPNTTFFAEVIHEGKKVSLWKRHLKKFIKAPKLEGYGTQQPNQYQTDYVYFLQKADGEKISIQPKKKNFLKQLTDKTPELEKFLAENKIDFSKDEDLQKFLTFYESL